MVHCPFDRSHGCGFILFAALGLRTIPPPRRDRDENQRANDGARQSKKGNENSSMIREDLSNVDGCPERGVSVTVLETVASDAHVRRCSRPSPQNQKGGCELPWSAGPKPLAKQKSPPFAAGPGQGEAARRSGNRNIRDSRFRCVPYPAHLSPF